MSTAEELEALAEAAEDGAAAISEWMDALLATTQDGGDVPSSEAYMALLDLACRAVTVDNGYNFDVVTVQRDDLEVHDDARRPSVTLRNFAETHDVKGSRSAGSAAAQMQALVHVRITGVDGQTSGRSRALIAHDIRRAILAIFPPDKRPDSITALPLDPDNPVEGVDIQCTFRFLDKMPTLDLSWPTS